LRSSLLRGLGRPAAAASAACAALGIAGVAIAAPPYAGGTYRGGALSAPTSLGGSLTVGKNGRKVTTMRLLFLTPPCPYAPFHQSTALPAKGISIMRSSFSVSGTVKSYAESGLRGPADTTVKGRFLPGGTKVAVTLWQVIRYPKNHQGCTTQTITAHGTFVLAA
jgi:hypothetical protein